MMGNYFNDDECEKCNYGDEPCPIAWINKECAASNEEALKIALPLIAADGECAMRLMMLRAPKDRLEREKQLLLSAWK